MKTRLLDAVLRDAAAQAADFGGGPLSDGELLRRYVKEHCESSFTALVSRHGRLVWSVCRQSLPCEADADDAFQAVFLAFARNAASIRNGATLGGWLHAVAVRICLKARRDRVRRKQREVRSAATETERPVADASWETLLADVHAEVAKLPDSQRIAFVMIDLEGVPQADAAAKLGWKPGTLTGRLCQARRKLMDRLGARGMVPGAALAACGLAGATTMAEVPQRLLTLWPEMVRPEKPIPAAIASLATAALEGRMMLRMKLLAAGVMLTAATAFTVMAAQVPGGRAGPTTGSADSGAPTAPAVQPANPPRGGGPGAGIPGMAPPGGPGGGPMGGPPGMGAAGGMPGMGGGMVAPSPARGFEYRFVAVSESVNTASGEFEKLGRDGWEFCAFHKFADRGNQVHALFKRQRFAGGVASTGEGFGSLPGASTSPAPGRRGEMGMGMGMMGGPSGAPAGIPGTNAGGIPFATGSPPPGGMSGSIGSVSGPTKSRKVPEVVLISGGPFLNPDRLAQSINSIYSASGIVASASPDGDGIVVSFTDQEDAVKALSKVEDLVKKMRAVAEKKADEERRSRESFPRSTGPTTTERRP